MRRLLCCLALLAALPPCPAVDASHPGLATDEETTVHIAVVFLDVDGIDSQNQSFEANIYIGAHWQDPRLAHDGPGPIKRGLNEVWTPNLQVLNQQKLFKTMPDIVRIKPDGQVHWGQRYWGSLSQPLDLQTFPFDRQEFTVQVVAATGEGGRDIAFAQSPELASGVGSKLSVADWTIIGHHAEPVIVDLADNLPKLEAFNFAMQAERKVGYYVVKVLIPLVLIVAMSWIVFWIDPTASGTQISVAITTMLTLIAYRFAVDSSLPRVSYLTSLDYFILVSTVLVYASLIEVLITAKWAQNEATLAKARKTDLICRFAFPVIFTLVGVETLFLRALV